MGHFIRALASALALTVAAAAAPALADSDYYIEIGRDTTPEGAAAEWKELAASHRALLKGLQFYPKSIFDNGVAASTRIQAGPIDSKSRAQRICAKLFKDDVPCFVIEGVEDEPPTAMMSLNDKVEQQQASAGGGLPWLHSSEVYGAPPVRETSALPWLAQPKQAEVQVAEAIRVPLTNTVPKAAKVTVKALPAPKPTFRKQFAQNKSEAGGGDGAGWLTVDAFPNADIATSFWDEVRGAVPKKQAGSLRVRIQRPLMSQKQGKASLSIGPFASSSDAYALCNNIQARERGLNCSYMGSDPVAAGATQFARADNYNARRNVAQARRAPTATSLGALAPAAGPSKQYWVQVVSAPSHMEALEQWDTLRNSNSDLLGSMRSSVSRSATDKSAFVVRVGPITSNDDAISFCTKLQGRGVDCRVLLYSLGI